MLAPRLNDIWRCSRVTTVLADAEKFPSFADLSGDFAYARRMQSDAARATGYADTALDAWVERALPWAAGNAPADLPSLEAPADGAAPCDVFIYFINGAKERVPAAAMALLARLGHAPDQPGQVPLDDY